MAANNSINVPKPTNTLVVGSGADEVLVMVNVGPNTPSSRPACVLPGKANEEALLVSFCTKVMPDAKVRLPADTS